MDIKDHPKYRQTFFWEQYPLTSSAFMDPFPRLLASMPAVLPSPAVNARHPASDLPAEISPSSSDSPVISTVFDFASLPEIVPENAGRLGQVIKIPFAPRDLVMAVAWSPDGGTLAVSAGEFIHWYDSRTWQEVSRYRIGAFSHSMDFSSNAQGFALGSRDGFIRVWNNDAFLPAEGAPPVLVIKAHKKGVNSVEFSPDSRLLASGGNDAVARFWEPLTGNLMGMAIGGTFSVPTVAFSPDGLTLAVVNGKVIRLRQVGSDRIIGTIRADEPLYSLAFSPNGQIIATGNLSNLVQLWDSRQVFHTGQETYPDAINLVGHSGKGASFHSLIWKVVFSPDGRLLASAGGDQTIRIWDVANGKLLTTLFGHGGGVTCIAFRPDAHFLASGGLDSTLRIWGINE